MFNDLVLVHQKTPGEVPTTFFTQDSFALSTCLRKIAVGSSEHLNRAAINLEQFEIFEGAQAYRFMLEVICGLKSPLVGETEIFGQFKTAASQYESVASLGSAPLRKFLRALNEDAKRVRDLHLKDLGSQSYGSLVRKELKGIKHVHIIGAGQLTRDILPWLSKDGAVVHVHARDSKRAQKSLVDFPNVKIHPLSNPVIDISSSAALIVAAPVEASWLNGWAVATNFDVLIDLRGDSHLDCLALEVSKSILLNELFERITENQNILHERKDRALKEINQAVTVREQHVEYRPFGWEDVCA